MKTIETMIAVQKVVSRAEWIAARKKLLTKEKESTRLRDQLSAERRKLPWVKVEKQYVFDGPKAPSGNYLYNFVRNLRGCLLIRPTDSTGAIV